MDCAACALTSDTHPSKRLPALRVSVDTPNALRIESGLMFVCAPDRLPPVLAPKRIVVGASVPRGPLQTAREPHCPIFQNAQVRATVAGVPLCRGGRKTTFRKGAAEPLCPP